MKDLTGQTFGYWTVLGDSGLRKSWKGKPRNSIWKCRCKCGTLRNVTRTILHNESKPRSCGCSRKDRSINIFESNIDKTLSCWIWKGSINKGGYGKFGQNGLAHRFSYKIYVGKIGKGKQVCHTCDNRKCVNPLHLFLGSISANMRDRDKKNRQAKGSKIANSILTEDKVLSIRKMRLSGEEYQQISKKFKIDWYLVRAICKNRAWKHVDLGEECKNYKSKAWGFSSPRPINFFLKNG